MTETVNNNKKHCIAIDAMGGDFGLDTVVAAVAIVLKKEPLIELILVGDEPKLTAEFERQRLDSKNRVTFKHSTQVVEMGEKPSTALRSKKDSSMRVSINLVKNGEAHACVSSGNTGALMATARYVLKMLPGIDRPAIITPLPSVNGHTYALDLGANVDSTADHLFQFAVMGATLVSTIHGIERPKVGLLNIGEEEIKGNDSVKQASVLLQESNLNYIGFIEGDEVYTGDVDVAVCDGFVGNVALKASEGIAQMINGVLKAQFKRNILTRLMGLISLPVLNQLHYEFDHRRYNGATLLGVNGVVIKSHGGTDAYGFSNAILTAITEANFDVPNRIRHLLPSPLEDEELQ